MWPPRRVRNARVRRPHLHLRWLLGAAPLEAPPPLEAKRCPRSDAVASRGRAAIISRMTRGGAGKGRAVGACGAALLACVACGDGDEKTTSGEMQPEALPPGTVELDPSRAPPRGGDGVTPAPLDTSPTSDAPDTRYREFIDALDREIALRCGCEYEALGHPSGEVCHQRLRKPDFVARL